MSKKNLQDKIFKRLVEKHKQDTSTVSSMHRMLKLFEASTDWKVSNNKDNMAEIENTIWSTRGCFQSTSNEWNQTSMEEKIKLLHKLKKNENLNTLELSLRVMDIGTQQLNKDITELDLILSMSEIIDYLLEQKA